MFSAGAVLYDMATAHRAFTGETPSDIGAAIVTGAHVPVTQRRPLIPDAIDAVIERALEKAPDERYQSAAEMITDLRRARRRLESSPSGVAVRRTRRGARMLAIALGSALLVLSTALLCQVLAVANGTARVTRCSSAASRTARTTRTSTARCARRSRSTSASRRFSTSFQMSGCARCCA